MKRLRTFVLLGIAAALHAPLGGQTLPTPLATPVTANTTTGALRTPANFWEANAAAISAEIADATGLIPWEEPAGAIGSTETGLEFLVWSPNAVAPLDEGFAGWVSAATFRDRLGLGTAATVSFGTVQLTGEVQASALRLGMGTNSLLQPSLNTNITATLPTVSGTLLTTTGNGGGLTALNATAITTGTLDAARLPAAAVQIARTITTTAPLTGGGDLSANRTLGISAATESAVGVVELATAAEAITGTDTTRANTPAAGRAALSAYVDPIATTRQPLLGVLFSDGATINRRIAYLLTAATNPSASILTEAGMWVRVPAANPAAPAILWAYASTDTPTITTANALMLYVAPNGDLVLTQRGADGTNDHRTLTVAGWRAANSGAWAYVPACILSPDTTAPVLRDLAGVALTAPTTSGGVAPLWMALTGATHRVVGLNIWANEFCLPTPFNRALTAAEIAQMVQTGALLPVDRLGGSMVQLITGDDSTFATDTGFWSKVGGATISAGGAQLGTSAVTAILRENFIEPGRRYLARAVLASGTSLRLGWAVSGGDPFFVNVGANVYECVFIPGSGSLPKRIGVYSTDSAVLDSLTLISLGALLQPEITRTAQVLDHGPNRIRGIATAGIRPLSDRDPVGLRGNQAATGFVLGLGASDPIWYEPGLITGLRIKQAAATAQTITLRLNTSGGTTIATMTTAASTDWQVVPLAIPGGFEITSGDRIHWTITGAMDWDLAWSRR